MGKRWLPLESNPDVITEFASKIGLNVSECGFYDIYGLDDELLMMVPQPVLAVLLLFPITKESEEAAKKADAEGAASQGPVPPSLYYMKQTISNACGTIAMLHSLGNNRDKLPIDSESFLDKFFSSTATMTPEERGTFLEAPPEGAPDIEEAHKESAEKGDTEAPDLDAVVDLHFVCFVEKDGNLYELDGRRVGPVNHGPCNAETLLQDTAKVVKKQFIEGSTSIQFNLMALAKAEG